jgi:hypothetical protein
VAFDLTFMDSGIADPYTVLIDMKANAANFDRLEVSSNGEWALSRLEPNQEEIASGTYILVGGDGNSKNARMEVRRSHLQDLFSKEVSVYCEMSDDRMPDNDASPSYYALKETSHGTLAKISDPESDVESFPDMTELKVSAYDNEVRFKLSVVDSGSSDDMDVTITFAGPSGIGPNDQLTVTGRSGSWNRRRSLGKVPARRHLQDDESDSVTVEYSFTSGSCSPYPCTPPSDKMRAHISFPRKRIPDLMTRLISVYSDKSKDRLPDSGEILLVDGNQFAQ